MGDLIVKVRAHESGNVASSGSARSHPYDKEFHFAKNVLYDQIEHYVFKGLCMGDMYCLKYMASYLKILKTGE
jgi:hypothetical protein